jgi:hypothetical protein
VDSAAGRSRIQFLREEERGEEERRGEERRRER